MPLRYWIILTLLAPSPLYAKDSSKSYTFSPGIEAGAQSAREDNLYWGLTPATFDPDRHWWEFYIEPDLRYEITVSDDRQLYGNLSFVASGTLEKDAYDTGNTGRITLEKAFLGLRQKVSGSTQIDISVGPQEYVIGNGMLVSNGSSNGFDRGALKLGPRKAWEMTAIGRVHINDLTAEVFYLTPNENPDNDSDNKLVGAHVKWESEKNNKLAIVYGNVFESETPSVKAGGTDLEPPTIIPGGREGLEFIHTYGRWHPLKGKLSNFWFGGDFAYQFNSDIDLKAFGGRVEVGYALKEHPWRPNITYNYQYFSGDDPATPDLERFDPLFYNGNPGDWATGSKATLVFINSNVNAHQLIFNVSLSPKDIVTLYASHIRASEERSPLQFGQATRVTFENGTSSVISGVTDKHVADDVFLKYTRIVNRNTFLTVGVSASFPGEGIDTVTPDVDEPVWTGGFANIVFKF